MDREVLLKRIQVCDFALNDAALYLDTHPDDVEALRFHKKYQDIKKTAVEAFTAKYGPLTKDAHAGGSRWTWVDGPWPWHSGEA
jgi:spore coat protein JB